MRKYLLYIFILMMLTGFTSVKGDSAGYGNIELIIRATVSGKPLQMDSAYLSAGGEQYHLKKLRFYMSALAFAKSTGTESPAITDNNSGVFLFDFGDEKEKGNSIRFKMKAGDYSDLRFNVGVPREQNHNDPATALPPLDLGRADMFWNWNSGYIFLLAEGYGKDVYKDQFHFAVGSDQRVMPLSFGNLFNVVPLLQVEKGKTTRIYLDFDFNKLLVNGDGSHYSFKSFESAIVHGGYHADMLSMNAINCFQFVSAETEK